MHSKEKWTRRRLGIASAAMLTLILVIGCSSPVSTGIQLGVKAVGNVVNDASTASISQQLVGKPPAAADELLGARENVWSEVNGNRMWLVYPVKGDVLARSRYVAAVNNDRIVTVQMVGKAGGKVDFARGLSFSAKAKGKTPAEATDSLGLGAPVLVVHSESTNQLVQIYNAKMIQGIGSQEYCLVRFDDGICTQVEMVTVKASGRES